MILKIKKRDFIFLLSSFLIAIPLIIAGLLITSPIVLGAINRSFFIVELTITGRAPTVFYVNWTTAQASGDLVDGSTASFNFTFNVSDLDGFDNINHSKTVINITLGGAGSQQAYNSSNCTINNYNTNYTKIACIVLFKYWANASANWVVNASVTDNAGLRGYNDTLKFTVNTLTGMRLEGKASINWTSAGVTAGANDVAADEPLTVNNTGNFDFSAINISAKNLIGRTTPSDTIGAGNISVNITNAPGIAMNSTKSVTIPSATLTHGEPPAGNASFYFYIDIPSGLSAQTYNATNWEIVLE